MELISRAALIAALDENVDVLKHARELIRMTVIEAPTIDAVPVVRCKDCQRYYQYTDNLTGKQYNFGRCNKRYTSRNGEEAIVTDNDFCSQGVRKEQE